LGLGGLGAARLQQGMEITGDYRMQEELQYAVLHEFVAPARRNISRGAWDYLMGGNARISGLVTMR
jgi:hypothetical protein